MNRFRLGSGLLFSIFACLAVLGPPLPAIASPQPTAVDQAAWTGRKQMVRLSSGIDLAFVELGDPKGMPLVLLHGYTDTSRLWSILAPQLGRYRVLIPDQRGHGASAKPRCCYALSDFADDLLLFLDAKKIDRAAIAGSSLGSMVAQRFAADHPERTIGVVLAASTAKAPIDRDHWLYPIVTDSRAPANRQDAFLKEWSPGASPTPVDASLTRYFDGEMRDVPTHVWRSVIRELVDVPVARHAADVRVPVLVLNGGKDPLFGPDHHRSLAGAYQKARSHTFADLGHNLVVERPEEVGPVFTRFLDELATGSRP